MCAMEFEICKATREELSHLADLALLLWPHHTYEEFMQEFSLLLEKEDAVFFLARIGDTSIGFAQCQLRRDYVEGTSSSPTGYLEGIYVKPEFRGAGAAGRLLKACEDWSRCKGCTEFASDCELTNQKSYLFHRNCGFEEANRIICFVKKL